MKCRIVTYCFILVIEIVFDELGNTRKIFENGNPATVLFNAMKKNLEYFKDTKSLVVLKC